MEQTAKARLIGKLKVFVSTAILIALTALAGWGIYTLPDPLVDRMLESDLRHHAVRLERKVESQLFDVKTSFERHILSQHDEAFLSLLPETSDIYRFKLFDSSGEVFWSTRDGDVGSVRYGDKSLPRITISVGVAHYPAHGTMPQDLMRAADDARYSAKDNGRNQVRVASGNADTAAGRPGPTSLNRKPDAA